jgi:hypothetical protein
MGGARLGLGKGTAYYTDAISGRSENLFFVRATNPVLTVEKRLPGQTATVTRVAVAKMDTCYKSVYKLGIFV